TRNRRRGTATRHWRALHERAATLGDPPERLLALRQVVDDDGGEALAQRGRERRLESRLGLDLLGQRRPADRLRCKTAHQRFVLDLELGPPARSRVRALAPEAALRARLIDLALQAL